MMKRKVAILSAVLAAGVLIGCGSQGEKAEDTPSVYFYNADAGQAKNWEAIAAEYTSETGVPVKVATGEEGSYEYGLLDELAKEDAPTLFLISGSAGYDQWKEYCLDLKDTQIYSWLKGPELAAYGEDESVWGLPYSVESYGIVYNQDVISRYIGMDGAVITSMKEVKSFDTLKALVEDMTAKQDELAIKGVFASTSFAPGEDDRWNRLLMNLPLYYEYKDDGVWDKESISFSYNQQYKNIFDLYINNSCTQPDMLGTKSDQDSIREFALGQVAMMQNDSNCWDQVKNVDGNIVKEGRIKFLPIYTGTKGEKNQGLCTGSENFFSVNSQASKEDSQATLDFLQWLLESERGKDFIENTLGVIAPYTTFDNADDAPENPMNRELLRFMNSEKLTSVTWNMLTIPSETFTDNLSRSLLSYAVGETEWETLVSHTIEDWSNEKKKKGDSL